MRIQSIGIFANPNNEGALASVSSVYGVARSRGIKCFIDRSFANMEEFSGLHFPDLADKLHVVAHRPASTPLIHRSRFPAS